MRLLLDTHIWLWSHLDPPRLSPDVAAALEDAQSDLWLSPISTWELLVLVDRGRVRLSMSPEAWIAEAMRLAPMNEAPVTQEVALATREVVVAHHDPADRFLAATARVLDLTLVTADRRLLAGEGFQTMANR